MRWRKSYLEAAAYRFELAGFRDYVADVQFVSPIEMAEAWHLKPFLDFAIVEQIAAVCGPLPLKPQEDPQAANAVMAERRCAAFRDLVESLQTISDLDWKDGFLPDRFEREDFARGSRAALIRGWILPAARLTAAAVAELAKGSKRAEHEIATHAIDLAHEASELDELERTGSRTALACWLLPCG